MDVTTTKEGAEKVLHPLEFKPGVDCVIRVADAQGYPVTGVGVVMRDQQQNVVATQHFADMPYEFLREDSLEFPLVPPGSYEVTLVHPRYASVRIPVAVNVASRLPTVTLSPGSSLDVVVRDSGGNAAPQAEVSVLDGEGRNVFDDWVPALEPTVGNPSTSPFTAEDGTLALGHLKPGQYRVAARTGTARSGDSEVTVAASETATVRLILTDE